MNKTTLFIHTVSSIIFIVCLFSLSGISLNPQYMPKCLNDSDTSLASASRTVYAYEQIVPGIGLQTVTHYRLFGDSTKEAFYCRTF